jgi:hypothetical protein
MRKKHFRFALRIPDNICLVFRRFVRRTTLFLCVLVVLMDVSELIVLEFVVILPPAVQ